MVNREGAAGTDAPQSSLDESLQGEAASERAYISAPLYIAGGLGTLAAVCAVMANLGIDPFEVAAASMAVVGYVVSYSYRKAGLPPRLINTVMGAVAALLVAMVATGRISIGLLEPATEGQGDLQLAVTLEWLAVLYTWTLTDDRKVVTAAILAISTIGLVAASDVNPPLIACFIVYVIATVFLLIHQNYLLHWHWGRIDIRQGSGRLLAAQTVFALACCLFVVLAGMVLVVPLQEVGSKLSLSTALRGLVLAGGTAGNNAQATASSLAVSDSRNFPIGQGGSGDEFSLSKQIIFRVLPSDHGPHYWRGNTYDSYNGQGWNSSLSQPSATLKATSLDSTGHLAVYPVPPASGDPQPGARLSGETTLQTQVELVAGQTDNLYVPGRSFAIYFPREFTPPMIFSPDGHITLPISTSGLNYTVTSIDDSDAEAQLRKEPAKAVIPAPIRKMYIDQADTNASASDQQLLADTARQIVASLPADRQDEYDRAEAIRGWVADQAMYSLDVPSTPAGQDAVVYFLFSSRVGYCDLYASSMALLCRYAGIPARVATGFAPGESMPDGSFNLRAIDKHAWCQVYFPNRGWCDFDPTSSTRLAPKLSGWARLLSSLHSAWASFAKHYRTGGPIPIVLTVAILGGLGYIFATEGFARLRARSKKRRGERFARDAARQRGRDTVAVRVNAERRWQAARADLRRWNLRQKPSETAREFADRAGRAAARLSQHANASAKPARSTNGAVEPPDAVAVARALSQLAASYTEARYAATGERPQRLIDFEESGESDRELASVRGFVAWSRLVAGKVEEE